MDIMHLVGIKKVSDVQQITSCSMVFFKKLI